MKLSLLAIVFCVSINILHASDTTKLSLKHTFSKGSHFSKPRGLFSRLIRKPDTLRWECSFDSSCQYKMTTPNGSLDDDQWDYNKLTGVSFSVFSPHINTAMVGWRFNPKTFNFELVPYWHISHKRFFKENPFVSVLANESFTVEMQMDYVKKRVKTIIKSGKNELVETQQFAKLPKQAVLIHPYFGGNKTAPKAMFLLCKRMK